MLTLSEGIILSVVCYAQDIKGVGPDFLSTYQEHVSNGRFQCLSDSNTYGVLNDDFCDCSDGSDEPGTSACSGIKSLHKQRQVLLDYTFHLNFSFIDSRGLEWSKHDVDYRDSLRDSDKLPGYYCEQSGFIPRYVPAWSVGDNICDCCDGADEYPLHETCPNTCSESAHLWSEEKKRIEREIQDLSQQSSDARQNGQVRLQGWIDDIESSRSTITSLEQEIKEAESKLKEQRDSLSSSSRNDDKSEIDKDCSDEPCNESKESEEILMPAEPRTDDISEYAKWMAKEGDSESLDQTISADNEKLQPSEVTSKPHIRQRLLSSASKLINTFWNSIFQPTTKNEVNTQVKNETANVGNVWSDIVADKKNQLRNTEITRDEAAKALQNELFRTNPAFIKLHGRSFRLNVGERIVDLSIDGSISEQEGWYGRKLDLGSSARLVTLDTVDSAWSIIMPSRYQQVLSQHALLFAGGSPCSHIGTEKNHETLVFLVCSKEDALILKEEPAPCQHVAVLTTPISCAGDFSDMKHLTRDGAPRRKRMGGDPALIANFEREEL